MQEEGKGGESARDGPGVADSGGGRKHRVEKEEEEFVFFVFYLTIISKQYTHTRYPCHTYII